MNILCILCHTVCVINMYKKLFFGMRDNRYGLTKQVKTGRFTQVYVWLQQQLWEASFQTDTPTWTLLFILIKWMSTASVKTKENHTLCIYTGFTVSWPYTVPLMLHCTAFFMENRGWMRHKGSTSAILGPKRDVLAVAILLILNTNNVQLHAWQ